MPTGSRVPQLPYFWIEGLDGDVVRTEQERRPIEDWLFLDGRFQLFDATGQRLDLVDDRLVYHSIQHPREDFVRQLCDVLVAAGAQPPPAEPWIPSSNRPRMPSRRTTHEGLGGVEGHEASSSFEGEMVEIEGQFGPFLRFYRRGK